MRKADFFPQTRFERATRRLGLYLLAPALLSLTIPAALQIADKADLGFTVHRLEIVSVQVGGPAADTGLRPGDRVTKVGEADISSMPAFYAAVAGTPPLQPLVLTVERQGVLQELRLRPGRASQERLIRSYSLWVVGLAFLMIGWWVLWRRPDPIARNFYALCFSFAFFLLDLPDLANIPYMTGKELLRNLVQFMMPAYFLRFFMQFPAPRLIKGGRPAPLRFLLVPGLILFLVTLLVQGFHPDPTGSSAELVLEGVTLVYALGFVLTGLVLFTRRILKRDRPIQRTKMVVILLGLLGGLIPFFGSMLISTLAPGSAVPQWQYLAFSLLLVPASFGLAIMRYGALDTAFVVRTSLTYGLLTLMVLGAYLMLTVGLGRWLSWVFGVSAYPVLPILTAGMGLAVLPLRRVAQRWVDRTFYPSRLANRTAIVLLANQMTELIDSEEVIEVFSQRLQDLFRPASFALYLLDPADDSRFQARIRLKASAPVDSGRGKGGSDPAAAVEDGAPQILPVEADLPTLLNRIRRPVFTEELETHLLSGTVDAGSRKLLTRLQTALLVPLVTGNRLLGFLGFGAKGSGALYSQEDLSNLHAFALQAASLVESRRLYRESLDRKRLDTEMEVARDIQARLLPAEPLAAEQFRIVGLNEPCRMVGGDYFDYFLRPDGSLGFAIADVAGKGIPAALQMTSVQAAFRNLAEAAASPSAVIAEMNTNLEGLVASGQFVCFFFGIYDPRKHLLVYCNAGMDPPVLFRPGADFRQRLKKGGPVLGVAPDYRYREGTVPMQPGDRLFLYTDGMTDQTNPAGEFFDEERLLDLVGENPDFPLQDLIATIFRTVNDFGGTERADDKTAILLKILK